MAGSGENPTMNSWDISFINWFSGLKIPTIERKSQIGQFGFHHFSSSFELNSGNPCTSHGRSQSRGIAAVKCAAEAIERLSMSRFFSDRTNVEAALIKMNSGYLTIHSDDVEVVTLPPPSLRSSNGWAVHSSPEKARLSAWHEALERHLLLKSYLKFGWAGFQPVDQLNTSTMKLHLLTSRVRANDLVAGIVVAHSPLFPGVTFGYCNGSQNQIQEVSFWENAIFEALGSILPLSNADIEKPKSKDSWMHVEGRRFLREPFNFDALLEGRGSQFIEENAPCGYLNEVDLTHEYMLDFPLHAAFVWGQEFIPLFPCAQFGKSNHEYLDAILSRNALSCNLPERHPIL